MKRRAANRGQTSAVRRRGFALLIAIMMIALVGTASVSLMILLRDAASRTIPAADDAQLRQLLIAGGMVAPQLLPPPSDAGGRTEALTREIALPPALTERGAAVTLRSERGPGGVSWLVHVAARLEDRSVSQTVHFVRTARGWSAAEARMTPDPRQEQPLNTGDAGITPGVPAIGRCCSSSRR